MSHSGSVSNRPKTTPAALHHQPNTNYGTIKLVGLSAEEMMAKWGEEETKMGSKPTAQRTRTTVEDIAGLMQTCQRAQDKGKQSFWEKNREKKAEKEKLRKKKKEEKKKAKELKEKKEAEARASSSFSGHKKKHTREFSEGGTTPLRPPKPPDSKTDPKKLDLPPGKMYGPSSGTDRLDSTRDTKSDKVGHSHDKSEKSEKSTGSGSHAERADKSAERPNLATMFVERVDTKPEIKMESGSKSTESSQNQAKPKLWKTLTRTTKKKTEHDDEKSTMLAKYLLSTPPKPSQKISRENSEKRGTHLTSTSDREEDLNHLLDHSLNVLATNLETLEKELKSSSSDEESSSSSATPDSLLVSDATESKSAESVEEPGPFEVHPGMEVTILEKLGKGATAIVWRARVSGRDVALKQISLKTMKLGTKSGEIICKHEYDLVKSLSHPNIIRYHGIIFNPKDHEVNLFMELILGSNLTDLVLYSTSLKPPVVAYILCLILKGISYLHSQCIIHRDVKPDNILLTLGGNLKIVDFGTFSRDTVANICRQRSTVGTPWYCAPEIINGDDYSNACDIWSIGCMVIEMVSGKPPFEELNDVACLFKMAEGKPPPFPSNATPDCNKLLTKALAPNWKDRPSASELLDFDFITSFGSQRVKTKAELIHTLAEMHRVQATHQKKQFERLTQRITAIDAQKPPGKK